MTGKSHPKPSKISHIPTSMNPSKKKGNKKAMKKPPKSHQEPTKKPQEAILLKWETQPPKPKTTDGPSISKGTESEKLDQIIAGLEQSAAPSPGQEQEDKGPDVSMVLYKKIAPHAVRGIYTLMDVVVIRGLTKGKIYLEGITPEEIQSLEDDAAQCLKDCLDKILPDIAKRNPAATAFCLGMLSIAGNKIRVYIPPHKPEEPRKATTVQQEPAPPSPAQTDIKDQHVVEIKV